MMRLQGLRVLVIRPLRAHDSFVSMLESSGCTVYRLPVLAVESLPPETAAIKKVILEFDRYDKAVAVSANAARLAAGWLDAYWPQLPVATAFFAVGPATAHALKEAGIDTVFPADNPSSEGLLERPEMAAIAGERIVIFRGCGGRDMLKAGLEERGASVTYCDLYRRRVVDIHSEAIRRLLDDGAVDVVAAHSGALVEALAALMPAGKYRDCPLLVPAERVANSARRLGFRQVITAAAALPESMAEALGRWYTQK